MKFTVVAVEGDKGFRVLGTVEAHDERGALRAIETRLRGDGEKYDGPAIVLPGVVDSVYEGRVRAG